MIDRRALFAIALLLPMAAGAANCNTSATGPAFGIYNPLNAAPTDTNGSVTVSCTLTAIFETVNFNVSVSAGSSGNVANRRMVSGLNPLFYNLFDSAARTQILGDGSGGSVTINGNMTLIIFFRPTDSRTYTLFGRVPALQNAVPGAYSDTILVTVTY